MAAGFGTLATQLDIAQPTLTLRNALGHCATLLQILQHLKKSSFPNSNIHDGTNAEF